jgi:aspartokinase
MKPVLRVMKFGGTSVGDAACIRRAAAIVQSASAQGPVVAVVSAMSGVTNRLIKGAHLAQSGDKEFIPGLIGELRAQHATALAALVSDPARRAEIAK